MMKNNKILNKIIEDIFIENNQEWRINKAMLMCDDQSNESILAILNNHIDIDTVDFDIDKIDFDNEGFLCDYFGLNGYHKIRDAEHGLY